ncbi:MAG: class I SAM-dependent methyltransferase [Chloroflexota bacterium]
MMHEQQSELFNFDQCASCGLVFLNPRVPEADLKQYYTSTYLPYRAEEAWGKYAGFVKREQRNVDRKRVKRVKEYHPLTKTSRILDVGCGKPTFLAALQKDVPCQMLGLDFSDAGWVNEPEAFHGIQLRKGEIADLRGEQPVDVITMWHYLEHDYRPQHHLRQLLGIAHSDTRLIVEVPNFDSYTRRKFGKYWAGYHTPRHTALYSPKNINILFDKSGWQVESTITYGTLAPYTLQWMSRMEEEQIDWSETMEPRFIGYVAGMIIHAPIYWWQHSFSMGFLTVVGRPKEGDRNALDS